MTNQHPITPPPELFKQWKDGWFDESESADSLLLQAFQAGADQELEACVGWLDQNGYFDSAHELRAAGRPKPPSLKEQALEVFEALIHGDASGLDVGVIRRALEALPE